VWLNNFEKLLSLFTFTNCLLVGVYYANYVLVYKSWEYLISVLSILSNMPIHVYNKLGFALLPSEVLHIVDIQQINGEDL
jgi:hypothetical protein